MRRNLSMEEFVIGEENFHEGGARCSSAIFEKTMKKLI